MLIVLLLCKNLIAFIRISRRQLIHTGVKGFTAVSTVVFNKLRVLDRQKFPSRNFLSPRLPQNRNWNKFYFFWFFLSSPFSLWAVLRNNLYNVAMNWIKWLNYMTNVTIHRQATLLLFHNSIWLSNPNYAKFFYPKYIFFLFSWTQTYFFEPRIQNYGSHLKSIFIFFFYQLLENENLFPRCNVPGLKMTCQWKDKYVIYRLGGP